MTKRGLERRVIRAARHWYKWLTIDGVGADYHKYTRAFMSMKRAVAALAAHERNRNAK